jgi:hypothetical protein
VFAGGFCGQVKLSLEAWRLLKQKQTRLTTLAAQHTMVAAYAERPSDD